MISLPFSQQIPISEWMTAIHEVLGEGKPFRLRVGARA